jgi:pimeloyl-ACP methyl ester carboxylesterase
MNTNDLLVNWSTLSLDEIEARLQAGVDEEAAVQLFGANEIAEMETLLELPPTQGSRKAVVLLPGIMGSLLSSIRGVTTLLWINPVLFLKGQARYLELSVDGTRDGSPEIDAVPIAIERLVYTKIALALRRLVDLYEFPYDWRRPIEWNGDLLHRCLERWAEGDPHRRFTLVGHSMGGLVARTYLARHTQAAERRIESLIMLGTPHFGAATAVENLLKGNSMMALAAKLNDKNVPERLLMNLPSVYQLLPAPPELFPAHRTYPANWDLYDANAWELEGLRQDYLDAGRAFHKLLAGADPQVSMTEIAGCNMETIVDVQRRPEPDGKPRYEVIRTKEGPDAGDATVPLWSAVLPGAAIYYAEEVHRHLPKNKKVIQATLDLIHGGVPDLPADLPPRSAGIFDFAEPESVDVTAEKLRQHLKEGTATGDELAQLYFAF